MAEVTINIGGRSFQVVCQEGQEKYLYSAAEMLDQEAAKLDQSSTRLTESRMLLMSGLMLADKATALEERAGAVDSTVAATALEEEKTNTRRVQTELDTARQEIITLKSAALDAQARLDAMDVEGAKDVNAELEASRAEVASLNQRLVVMQSAQAASKELSSEGQSMSDHDELQDALKLRDAAVTKMDSATALKDDAESERDAAIDALRRVVEKLETVAE